ncbi:hypothetical protein [Sphingobacterium spiritivorum]
MPEKFIFPANKNIDTISLKFFRSGKLTSKEYILGLELLPTADFNTNLFDTDIDKTSSRKIKIYLSDILKPTKGWEDTPSARGSGYYLGTFSKKKLELISMLFDGAYSFNELYYEGYVDYFADIFAFELRSYLLQEEAKGTPVLEADGRPMKLGPYFN